MEESLADKAFFHTIWEKVIKEEIKRYEGLFSDNIKMESTAETDIWDAYQFYSSYCVTNYMQSKDILLDRHKVAACYMAAVAIARPVRLLNKSEIIKVPVNERLAITVGLSVLRAYVVAAINAVDETDITKKKALLRKFKDGIIIPSKKSIGENNYWGNYLENYMEYYCNELYHAVYEGKLNILSLANELYLLEVITRITP